MAPECLPICICNPQINCKQMPAVNVDVKRLSFSADPIYMIMELKMLIMEEL